MIRSGMIQKGGSICAAVLLFFAAAADGTPALLIIPQPQEWAYTGYGSFTINASTQIVMNTSPDSRELNTAQQLRRKVWDTTGQLPAIVQGSSGAPTTNVIAIGDPARNTAVSTIIAGWAESSGKAAKAEGYLLGVKSTSIVIRGFDNAGTFYGCQTLIQILEAYGTSAIDSLFSYDYPELPWRGMYFRIKWEHEWAFTKEIISEVVTRYKMNRLMPDVSVHWDSHPELPTAAPNYPTDANYADLVNFARLHYITDIQSVNASVFGTDGTLHTDLKENQSIPVGDPNNLCPRNPNSRKLLNDLWDEVRNDFGGSYMQVGQSEYSQLGWSGCPYCGSYSHDWLYSNSLSLDRNDLYVGHGVTPIIWGDMLRADMNGGPTHWNTSAAVATMPNETIIFDWQYGSPGNVPTDYPSLDTWIAYGKRACGSPFGFGNHPEYSQFYGDKENIYYWAKAVNTRRPSHPDLMLGIVAFNKYTVSDKRAILDSPLQMDELEEWPFVAEWSWHPEGRWWNPWPFDGKQMVIRELSPDHVSGFTATRSSRNVNLSWTNPPDSQFVAACIVYRTDAFPANPIDGTLLADVAGSPGALGSYTHVNAGSSKVYYAAFAHDGTRHFSSAATADVGDFQIPGDFDGDSDVDQEDFGWFQACYSGSAINYEPACKKADLDGDNDVDLDDFTLLKQCMNGPNNPPGC